MRHAVCQTLARLSEARNLLSGSCSWQSALAAVRGLRGKAFGPQLPALASKWETTGFAAGFSTVALRRSQPFARIALEYSRKSSGADAMQRLFCSAPDGVKLFGRSYSTLGYTLRVSALVICGMNAAGFLVTAVTKTHKITDATGVGAFVASAWATHAANCRLRGLRLLQPSRSLLLAGCVTLWGVRLGGHLLSRVLAVGEDRRLRPFFPRPGEPPLTGPSIFPLKLGFFWSLQAAWAWVCLLPVTTSQALAYRPRRLWLSSTFFLLFIAGFGIEALADSQKKSFKNKPENKDRFITTGLYKYSRHPNYFGEILVWVSIYGLASYPTVWRMHPWVALSPLFTAFLLLKVSGVPNLEALHDKRYGADADYKAWKSSTNELIPWFPSTHDRNDKK